jgi:GNAT superfamily N-acetyltransferase
MHPSIVVKPLSQHIALTALIEGWLVSEWPNWYGLEGRGNAGQDVSEFAASELRLPIGLIAFEEGRPVGFAALKAESIPSHKHLSPWAASGYVVPEHRGRGIGAALLAGLVAHARGLGFKRVYCGTSTSKSLLTKCGWLVLGQTQHDGKALTVFSAEA